jgi:WhiB family redox-sensing transcriptional regulator
MPKYTEVNWELAECQGVETDLFYRIEEERNSTAYKYINAVRSICGRCPIQRDCLSYAFEHENFGVWGGLTSMERRSVGEPDKYPIQLSRALQSLTMYGITYKEVKETYEHSVDVRSLANGSTNNRKDGPFNNSRPRI